jgi:hypothetical protein
MYHSGKNPLRKVTYASEDVVVPKGLKVRRLHKAFLRYHDPDNWPLLRSALKRMGRADLIGNGRHQLVPAWQPAARGDAQGRASPGPRGTRDRAAGDAQGRASPTRGGENRTPSPRGRPFLTQHTGLPRVPPTGAGQAGPKGKRTDARAARRKARG